MNEQDHSNIRIRIMQESDIPDCHRLREQAGWNQTLSDWERFLSYNPQGCFVAWREERIVGTVCTIPYENRFGWVAMVIVDRECRRMGIGTLLLNQGIHHLEESGLTVKLDATPSGKMLYDTLGFQDEYGVARLECNSLQIPEKDDDCHSLILKDLDRLDEYDRSVFGASRLPVLTSYMQYFPQFAFHIEEQNRILGYIMAREGTHAFHIGPWVAEDPDCAARLLITVLQKRRPEKVFVDIVEPNPHVRTFLEKIGFREQRPFIRMFKGNNRHPGCPERIYGLSGPELG